MALIAAVVGGLRLFQVVEAPTMAPSLTGTSAATCGAAAAVTTCAAPRPGRLASEAGPSAFQDGSFAAEGHYLTPGGAEALGVRLTVTAGQVVECQVTVRATSPTARQFQRQFASRYARQVVSRDLESLAVSRVAGASLTSLGFDNALGQIRAAASDRR